MGSPYSDGDAAKIYGKKFGDATGFWGFAAEWNFRGGIPRQTGFARTAGEGFSSSRGHGISSILTLPREK
jgi:hypothetical protein